MYPAKALSAEGNFFPEDNSRYSLRRYNQESLGKQRHQTAHSKRERTSKFSTNMHCVILIAERKIFLHSTGKKPRFPIISSNLQTTPMKNTF